MKKIFCDGNVTMCFSSLGDAEKFYKKLSSLEPTLTAHAPLVVEEGEYKIFLRRVTRESLDVIDQIVDGLKG